MQIPDKIAMLLIAKIKNIGRKTFLYFFGGLISFFAIFYLTEVFGHTIRFISAFMTGIFFWLPVIGLFLERRNIISDLENGEMYYIETAVKTDNGYLHKNQIYEPLENSDIKETDAYILPISRIIIIKYED